MNMHVEQELPTVVEGIELMSVPKNFVSPQSNKPSMGIVQDSLASAFYLTLRDTFLEKEHVMQLLGFLESWDWKLPSPCILKPKQLWSGKQIISKLFGSLNLERFANFHPEDEEALPDKEDLNIEELILHLEKLFKTKPISNIKDEILQQLNTLEEERHFMSPSDTRVLIRDGELLSGFLCKKTIGSAPGSLIHVIALDSGSDAIRMFVDDIVRITSGYMDSYGMSIGIDDMIEPPGNEETVNEVLKTVEAEMEKMRQEKVTLTEFEIRTNKMLNDARTKVSENTLQNMPIRCSFKGMIQCGSKGSIVNPAQVIRVIGQNNVDGHRIPYSFSQRCLPHFTKGDYSPRARGFIKSNYIKGLTPEEFWAHATAGREGIIDTACKTSEIGYSQRRLCKAMEDVRTHYDGTVRNSLGEIIQFNYGEDGLDATYLEWQKIEIGGMKKEILEKRFKWDTDTLSKHDILKREWSRLQKDNELVFKSKNLPLPVHFRRLLDNIPKTEKTGEFVEAHVLAMDVFQLQQELWKLIPNIIEKWESPFAVLLRSILSSKRLCREHNIRQGEWNWVKSQIFKKYRRAIVSPGESVGTLAGQSIGEPATQVKTYV
jgi:DNA-directed RNA polymerase II subunit RPB1